MPLYLHSGKLVLFVHIPNAGGASIQAGLRRLGKECLNVNAAVRGLPCSPQHFHADLLQALIPRASVDYVFAVVRNPLDRIMAEYRLRMSGALAKGMELVDPSDWIADVVAKYAKNGYLLDNHIRPQAEFVTHCDKVYQLEAGLSQVFGDLAALLAAPLIPPREPPTDSPFPLAIPAITSGARQLVLDFYRSDFELFGYGLEA
jgi:hypothetical protein